MKYAHFAVILAFSFIMFIGCSGGKSNPIAPGHEAVDTPGLTSGVDDPSHAGAQGSAGKHLPLFVYRLRLGEDGRTIEAVPDRELLQHINVSMYLSPPFCPDCFQIYAVAADPVAGWIELYAEIRNPFSVLGAYDTRLILDAKVPGYGIINPDGYTELFDIVGEPRNPFFAFAIEEPQRYFGPGETHARQFFFYYPPGGFDMDDFYLIVEVSIPDNCPEPFEIVDIQLDTHAIPFGGGPVGISCRVHSWWDDIEQVTVLIEETGNPTPFYTVDLTLDSPGSDLYVGAIDMPPGTVPLGDYQLWIRTRASDARYVISGDPLVYMWQVEDIEIVNTYTAWDGIACTWGGIFDDIATGVAVDLYGNVYVTGQFSAVVDFDEDGPEPPRVSHGLADIFLIKFSPGGMIRWIRTWGGMTSDYANGVAVDPLGDYVYVVGDFFGVVDMDPGPGSTWAYSNGSYDAFVSKFEPGGDFLDVETFGGPNVDSGASVAADADGNVFITGAFKDTVILPWPIPSLVSEGDKDAFLARFIPEPGGGMGMVFDWAERWGGDYEDAALGVAADADGDAFVTGYFWDAQDYDPELASSGKSDVFLAKYSENGIRRWITTWGGEQFDSGLGVAVDDSDNVYATGCFQGETEFSPGTGIVVSAGEADAFLIKFRDNGSTSSFRWVETWGGELQDNGVSVATVGSDSVYVAGRFKELVDEGPADCSIAYVKKMEYDGDEIWEALWGGPDAGSGAGANSVAVDTLGDPYVAGWFLGTVDFDPQPSPMDEFHTSNGQMDAYVCKPFGPLPGQPRFEYIEPSWGYRNHIIAATIYGVALSGVIEVWLEKSGDISGQKYAETVPITTSNTQVTCNLSLYGVPPGMYDVCGWDGGNLVEPIIEGFEVKILPIADADWTFLVYIEEWSDLTDAIWENINEMEEAGSLAGDLNILVLWNKLTEPDCIYYIQRDESWWPTEWIKIISPMVDCGGAVLPLDGKSEKEIMEDFLIWAMGNYTADHYAFTIMTHGPWPYANAPIWTVRDACQTALDHPVCNVDKLDMIALEVCNMAYFETSYCLRNVTRSVVASELNIYSVPFFGSGFPYDDFLRYLRDNAATCTYVELGREIVESYNQLSWYLWPFLNKTLSAACTDDPLFSDVTDRLNDFADELIAALPDPAYKAAILEARLECGTWGKDCTDGDSTDLGFFAELIEAKDAVLPATLAGPTGAAHLLRDAIDADMIRHDHAGGKNPGPCPYEETGWLIWFPNDIADYDAFKDEYNPEFGGLGMGQTSWDDFLEAWLAGSGEFGWARTWDAGGGRGYGVATDGSGNVYVTGYFGGTVDFDPDGGDPHTSNGSADVFLSKFDSSGNFEWALTWGGSTNDKGQGVATDGSGNVYVTGYFTDTVDFNPSGGDPHTSNGETDVFLSKFDSSGDFEWARTWGGSDYEWGRGVTADSFGNVYVAGEFMSTVDFDPDGGDVHNSNGYYDVFLSRFDSSGNFDWARTWGGIYDDRGWGVAADGSGNVYVTGVFYGTADFDPGGGDPHTSNGAGDVFLSKFDSSGNFQWARTWGGATLFYSDYGSGVAANASGNVCVTGQFTGTADFDPGGGDPHTSNGGIDVFLSKFDSSGNFEWARTWGGSTADAGWGVAADDSGNVYVTGCFGSTADFAPTDPPCNEDPDEHPSNGEYEVFLTKHLPDGCW